MSNTFNLEIMASNRSFYSGPATIINLPTTEGRVGVMAHHANTVMAVVPGEIDFVMCNEKGSGQDRKYAAVSGGIIRIENNDVLLLVDTCESPEEIDIERAKRAEAEAREAMLQKKSKQEYLSARAQLSRAMNRIAVAKKKR